MTHNLEDLIEATIGANDEQQEVRVWVDTGFGPLNHAISGDYRKGLPVGRMVEMFGPPSSGKTAIATKAMASAQQLGGIACFMDHEQSFDAGLAQELGLDVTPGRWVYKQPETFEESVDTIVKLARAVRERKVIAPEAPIVAVFDSLASMVPQSKMFDAKGGERESGSYNMHDNTALARCTSAAFPALAQHARKFGILTLFLNQEREKPGVCLRGDVMIPFTDGTAMPIKDIVERKIAKEVWSWNANTGRFEPRLIEQWHDNGPVATPDEWVHIRSTGWGTRNGVKAVTVTQDHQILTRDGWKPASAIKVGDELLARRTTKINGSLKALVSAMMFGDSSVTTMGDSRATAELAIQDNNDPEYAKWKVDLLSPFFDFKARSVTWKGGSGIKHTSGWSHELMDWKDYNRNPLKLLQDGYFSDLALALWIMDDGYLQSDRDRYVLSLKRIKDADVLDAIADILFEHGYRSRVKARESSLVFDADSSRRISATIAPFVPPCMDRKLREEDRGKYVPLVIETSEVEGHVYERVTVVRPAGRSFNSTIKRNRYDIGVGELHNYLAGSVDGGFVVHNSYGDPKTTPGGKAPEFYASVRIQLSRALLKKDDEIQGQQINAFIKKNKVNRPFQRASWKFMFREDGSGFFDRVTSSLEHLKETGKLKMAGNYIEWSDGKRYYLSQLAKKIEEDGDAGYEALVALMETK